MSQLPNDRRYWKRLLRRVLRRTGGNADAEDLLHAAFIRLERYRAQHAVDNPAAFLIQTAVNIGIDEHRRAQFQVETDSDPDAAFFEIPDPTPPPDEVIDARDRLKRMADGLAQLPPRTREVFLKHRLEGVRYREIAVQLNLSESAVEKHIARAALFLANWMEES